MILVIEKWYNYIQILKFINNGLNILKTLVDIFFISTFVSDRSLTYLICGESSKKMQLNDWKKSDIRFTR